MRVLRYIKKTKKLGLLFRASAANLVPGQAAGHPGQAAKQPRPIVLGSNFSDADWAGDIDDRRSTSGMVTKINGTAVSWKSKKQTSVALSSAEAE